MPYNQQTSTCRALAISSVDGRYQQQLQHLANYFSEFALNRSRLFFELEWLKFLIKQDILPANFAVGADALGDLDKIIINFSITDFEAIKNIEYKTKHDVKAIEYFLASKLKEQGHEQLVAALHLGLTSEDINSSAYAYNLKLYVEQHLQPKILGLLDLLQTKIDAWDKLVMVSRTHGQKATPTTLGKEIAVFKERFSKQAQRMSAIHYLAKFSGAVGNYNSLSFVLPKIDWQKQSTLFLQQFGLHSSKASTQIASRDYLVELFNAVALGNEVLIDFCRDIWGYISLGYFTQQFSDKQVGSSIMPHKVNPINFENAEGNLELANGLFYFFATKLPKSRWQRDLTDSTILRNLGLSFGYTEVAYNSIIKGLQAITPIREVIDSELSASWELLTEALQTEMRMLGINDAYQQVQNKVQGKKLSATSWKKLIDDLQLPEDSNRRLKKLSPQNYIGYAANAKNFF